MPEFSRITILVEPEGDAEPYEIVLPRALRPDLKLIEEPVEVRGTFGGNGPLTVQSVRAGVVTLHALRDPETLQVYTAQPVQVVDL